MIHTIFPLGTNSAPKCPPPNAIHPAPSYQYGQTHPLLASTVILTDLSHPLPHSKRSFSIRKSPLQSSLAHLPDSHHHGPHKANSPTSAARHPSSALPKSQLQPHPNAMLANTTHSDTRVTSAMRANHSIGCIWAQGKPSSLLNSPVPS